MTIGPREITPSEQVDISRILADEATNAGLDIRAVLMKLGLSAAQFNLNGTPQHVWLSIVQNVYAGRSRVAGFRADAVARLIEVVHDELQGNAELAALIYRLGKGTPQTVASSHALFLSYATPNRADVDQLYEALRRVNPQVEVFLDYRSIQAGQDWLDVIRGRAGQSSKLVCWVTAKYLQSAFCNYEIGLADNAGTKIIPILAEQGIASMPAYLSSIQAIPAGQPPDFDKLAAVILAL